MNLSLYQLANEFKALEQKLLDAEYDEVTIRDTLEAESGAIEAKSVNVAMLVRNLEASAEQIKLAEKAMKERREALEKKAFAIKVYLFDNMKACGISKIESPFFNLTIKKNPPKLIIDDAGQIPSELYVYPEPPAPYPDNALIKSKLLAGEIINGAHIESGERIEIK